MENSTPFMQWAMNTTMQQEQPDQLMRAPAANGWIPGGTTGGSVGHMAAGAAPMDYDVLRLPPFLPNSAVSSNLSELAYRSQPTRRASLRYPRLASFAPYAKEHIMAERKRREKINQRFVELAAVIPGLSKMDKATILSNATRYVKELEDNLKVQEAAGSDLRSIDTMVPPIKKPRHATPVARKPLPDVEVYFSGKTVMVRIHCENGKGVIVKVLTEVEELHLGIIDANVMAFSASTLIITVTVKVLEGFTTVTAEEIIGRLNAALTEPTTA